MHSDLDSRFSAIAQWEPRVGALIDFDEAAARRRAAEVGAGSLSGWSLVVKDIFDWAGAPTRRNADFVPAEPAQRSAAVVEALIARGAFVMAKSVTTTFAYVDPGPTRNPWKLAHTPGGSSSGSAAAVAAGYARLALGSQTVGSINRPASFCGVVGFKPTYGRLPTDGVFPFAPSVDTVGLFTTGARDAQATFAALVDEPDVEAPRSLRIALVEDQGCEPPEPAMKQALLMAARRLAEDSHDVRPARLPAMVAAAYPNHWCLIAAEAAATHRQLFAEYGQSYTPKLRRLIATGQKISTARLRQVESHRTATIVQIDRLFDSFDLLLSPSAPGPAPPGLDYTGDPRMNLLWTYTGCPTLTLPAMLTDAGLPLGVQLVGRRMHDQQLLAAGLAIEKCLAFNARGPLPPAQDATAEVKPL